MNPSALMQDRVILMSRAGRLCTLPLLGILYATFASAQFVNPIKAAKDAYAKGKQQQNAQAPSPQSQPANTIATASNQSAAEPWTPPAESANATTPVLSDPLQLPELPKTPDVIGVHLGMNPQEALDVVHKQYPSDRFQEVPGVLVPFGKRPNAGFNVIMPDPLGTQDAILTLTAPPSNRWSGALLAIAATCTSATTPSWQLCAKNMAKSQRL